MLTSAGAVGRQLVMVYRKGESHVREPRASTGGFEAFKESISLQLAARAARLAEESPSLGTRSGSAAPDIIGSKQENRQNNLEKQVSPSRLFILGLGFAVGITVSAGVMYFFLEHRAFNRRRIQRL
jgi:hypothetical protein